MDNYNLLINALQKLDCVSSIGKSGGEKLPETGESDIDVFVFCEHVPDMHAREAAAKAAGASGFKLSESAGRFWGVCDFIFFDDAEVCLMYFSVSDMDAEIESVLTGARLDREDEYFYPTGRCATFLTMHILFDKDGYVERMQKRLRAYPPQLAEKLFRHHVKRIDDAEDFGRAVSRGDVLFYHATLESALDHFLQALFALNHCYFPSRKRTLQFVEGFVRKPQNCGERILSVIKWGSKPDTLSKSYAEWTALCGELSRENGESGDFPR